MADVTGERSVTGAEKLTLLFCVLLLLVPLLVTPVLPLNDYYNHVARFYLLGVVDGDPRWAASYTVAWKLLPNLGLDLLGTALFSMVSPLLGAKLLVALIVLLQFSGVIALHWALGGRSIMPVALLTTSILYSYILNWGFANFLFAMGLAFWSLAAWFRLRDRPVLAIAVGSILGVFILLAHGFAYAMYGVILAMLELGRARKAGESLAAQARGLTQIAVQAILPAGLFLASATVGSQMSALPTEKFARHLDADTLVERLWSEAVHRVETVVRVAESPFAWVDVVLFFATMALLVLLWRRRAFSIDRVAWPALGGLGLLAVITPPAMFGVGYVSDRVPLAFALVAIAAASFGKAAIDWRTLAVTGLGVIAVLRTAALGVGWAGYTGDYRDAQTLLDRVPANALVMTLSARSLGKRVQGMDRCAMYAPLQVPMRHVVTPLFSNPAMQPLLLTGRLRQSVAAIAADTTLKALPHHADDAALHRLAKTADFDYLFICGADRLRAPLPGGFSAERQGRFLLLKRNSFNTTKAEQ